MSMGVENTTTINAFPKQIELIWYTIENYFQFLIKSIGGYEWIMQVTCDKAYTTCDNCCTTT